MNSHNPFNTGGCSPCGGGSGDFYSRDQLVDRIIGDSYKVVKEVYCHLGHLEAIYTYLSKYGLIVPVDSDSELKDISITLTKYARVYTASVEAGYSYVDYLYVDDNASGIKPNDPTATGSWIAVGSSGASSNLIKIFHYDTVSPDQVNIPLPSDMTIVAVQTIYQEGIRQDVNRDFTFNPSTQTITLAEPIDDVGTHFTIILGVTDPDDDLDLFQIFAKSTGAGLIGTLSGLTVQQELDLSVKVLGNYNLGTYTLRTPTEAVERDGKWYAVLNQSDLPFTTTGNWSADVSKLTLINDPKLRSELASIAEGLGADLVNTQYDISVGEMLSLGRIVYPEMFANGIENPTDDQLWSNMFASLAARDDTVMGNSYSFTIDGRGKVYTLTQLHTLDINVGMVRNIIGFRSGGGIRVGNQDAGSRTRRHVIERNVFRYLDDGIRYSPYPIFDISRAFNTHMQFNEFWGGVSTAVEPDTIVDESGVTQPNPYAGKVMRAKYACWHGSRRSWGNFISGNEFFGGYIAFRHGYTNDHTGLTFVGNTAHHGYLLNTLFCNPAGALIAGNNIEHSENGAPGLVVTSGTNVDAGSTVSNPAQCVEILGNYFYNNGNGTAGTDLAPAGILIGYDVPGTMDFDIPGFPITSQNTAHSIRISGGYVVSPKQARAIKMRGLASLVVENVKYTYADGQSYGITFSGTCARSHAFDNRNQSSGVFDEVEYNSTSEPLVGTRKGTFTPALVGGTVAGTLVYSTRGGDYEVSNGQCKLSLWMTVGSVTTQPTGALTINLPVAIAAGRRSGGPVDIGALAGNVTYPVTATGHLDSDAAATLTASGTVTIGNSRLSATCRIISGTTLQLRLAGAPMDGSVIQATSDIYLSLSYPVAGATFTG